MAKFKSDEILDYCRQHSKADSLLLSDLEKYTFDKGIGKTILKKGTFKDGYLEKGTVNEFLKMFDGTLKNKERTGKGKLRYIHKNGKSYQEYIGEVRLHKGYGYVPHGNGKLTHYNGGISLGKFVNGLLKKGKMNWGSNKEWEVFRCY